MKVATLQGGQVSFDLANGSIRLTSGTSFVRRVASNRRLPRG